jgi:hypothetical protein|tara:strand:+ start:455 stop:745 length:291 start_codon:yes stop_codon:yes gene_type:complete
MSFSDVTRGQGSFVSRTKINERKGSFQVVRTVSGEIFEPTGSNANTAFIVTGHGYSLVGADGGTLNESSGLASGSIYNIGLSSVSASSFGTVTLLR